MEGRRLRWTDLPFFLASLLLVTASLFSAMTPVETARSTSGATSGIPVYDGDGETSRSHVLGNELALWFMEASDDNEPSAGRTRDVSGSGLHLSKRDDIETTETADDWFGHGYVFDGSEDLLVSSDSDLRLSGDLTFFLAFERQSVDRHDELFSWSAEGDTTRTNAQYSLYIRPDNTVYYVHESGDSEPPDYLSNNVEFTSTLTVGSGLHWLALVRDETQERVRVYVDGRTFIDRSYTRAPDGGEDGSFAIGKDVGLTNTNAFRGTMYEARVWDENLSLAVLQSLGPPAP